MAQVRLCQNITYDDLHYMVNADSLLRQLMGIETAFGYEKEEISYRRILDNVSLLDDKTLTHINKIIVEFGHSVFKKKEEATLCLKRDSFVVESNVHFPTDYNLLWDSACKCTDMITKLQEKHEPRFIKLPNKHSAVESNINKLENRGLDRCPDKVYSNFKRYVGLAVCTYNLRKIGNQLIEQECLHTKSFKSKVAA